MDSELEICWEFLLIWLNIVKSFKEFIKRWWVDPYYEI